MKAFLIHNVNNNNIDKGRKRPSSQSLPNASKKKIIGQQKCKEQIADLEKSIENLQKKKSELLYTEKKFNGAMKNGELRRALYDDFQNSISCFSERLQKRSDILNSYQEKVNAFSLYSEELPQISRNALGETLTTKNRSQPELLSENKVLVNQALVQERTMLVLKMKMRLCHDHRDLEELRSILNKMMGGGKNIDEDQVIVSKYKEVISIIKDHIKEEKKRIEDVSKPYNVEHESAVIIQKTWRGYIYRKNEKMKQVQNTPSKLAMTPENQPTETQESTHENQPEETQEPAQIV